MPDTRTEFAAPLLITGAAGFIGRNLAASLRARGYKNLLLYDVASPEGALADYAAKAAFVFHLAGVNRPANPAQFYTGNAGFTETLLAALRRAGNKAPVLLSGSAQAGNGSDYAKSKEAAEAAVLAHGRENGSAVILYRLPGVFGKWCRPAYNSVVATFCHNIARALPIEVRDPAFTLPLCYIDDVAAAFTASMRGALAYGGEAAPPAPQGGFWGIEPSYEVSLGWLADTLRGFAESRKNLSLPNLADGLTRKLWAAYLSYLPEDGLAYPLTVNADARGSFTEFFRTRAHGQVSVNVAKPGVTKGNHWHNTKNEKFLVVHGSALIRLRRVDGSAVAEYAVKGEELRVVDIPPGHTHNITNAGEGELVTLMWASEPFDPETPDTYFEEV